MKKRYILASLFGVMLCVGAMLLSQVGTGGAATQTGRPVLFKQIAVGDNNQIWALGMDAEAYQYDRNYQKWIKRPSPMRQ